MCFEPLITAEAVDKSLLEMKDPLIQQVVDEYGNGGRQEAFDKAKALGFEVVVPKPNQLQLDIDNVESENFFYKQFDILNKYLPVFKTESAPSKSGGEKKHITVTLFRDVTPLERVGLQAMLGSDRKRELLSFIRVLNQDEDPTVFFELPKTPPGPGPECSR
jgi:hypothetical protein